MKVKLEFGEHCVYPLYDWFRDVFNPLGGEKIEPRNYKKTVRKLLDSLSETYGEKSVSKARKKATELGILNNKIFPISSPIENEKTTIEMTFSCDIYHLPGCAEKDELPKV